MIIHYIAEENIFVFIVYMLSLQKKYESAILKNALKYVNKVNMLNSKILKDD